MIAIFGQDWIDLVTPIFARSHDLYLHGFIGKPGVSRAARGEELFFINQRPVENRTLHFGLLEGYHNSLMKGRYPVAILFLEMDPAGVDVNIHPAKREVRFHDDFTIRQFIVREVQEVLRHFAGTPAAKFSFGSTPAEAEIARVEVPRLAPATSLDHDGKGAHPVSSPLIEPGDLPVKDLASTVSDFHLEKEPEPAALQPPLPLSQDPVSRGFIPRPEPLLSNRLGLRVVGCVALLYIVAEGPDGMVLIDQHAAHERVLFEQMLRRMALQDPASQQLLFPVTLEFLPREVDFLLAQLEPLQKAGVGITRFGPGTFLVDAMPAMVKVQDVAEFIRTILIDLQQEGGETRKSRRLSEEVVAKTVCRHAVKANDALKPAEWDHLLHDLLACDLPYTCPHGRPTMIHLSFAELEKKFGRIN